MNTYPLIAMNEKSKPKKPKHPKVTYPKVHKQQKHFNVKKCPRGNTVCSCYHSSKSH